MKTFKSLLRTVHTYSGAVLAVIFFIMGVTGAAFVFEEEMLQAAHKEAHLDEDVDIYAATDTVIESIGARRIAGMKIPHDNFTAFRVGLKNGRKLIVSAEGERLAVIEPFSTVTGTIAQLHMNWFAGSIGKYINGLFAACLMVFALSGILLWPMRGFRWSSLAPKRFDPPSLHAMHRNLGVLISPFIFLAAATAFGVIFSSPISNILSKVAGPNEAAIVEPVSIVAKGAAPSDAMRVANEIFPEAEIIQVQPAPKPGGVHKIRMLSPGELNTKGYTLVYVSTQDGSVQFTRDARNGSWNEKLMESLLPLHSGHTGWPGHKLIAAATGVCLAALAMAGFSSFWLKRRRKKPAVKRS